MNKNNIYNFYIKTTSDFIFCTLKLLKNKMIFCSYIENCLDEKVIKHYSIKNNCITFDDFIFSTERIKYKNIDITFKSKNKNMFYNKINFIEFEGFVNNKKQIGKIYTDTEKYKKHPFGYRKMLYISDNLDLLISYTNAKFINYYKIKLYLDINGNVIKDNSYISCKNKKNIDIIKTYQYIYKFESLVTVYENKSNNLNCFSIKNMNVSINKTFKETLINIDKLNMIVFTYEN